MSSSRYSASKNLLQSFGRTYYKHQLYLISLYAYNLPVERKTAAELKSNSSSRWRRWRSKLCWERPRAVEPRNNAAENVLRVRARADSKRGRGTFGSDNPPVVTLVRRSDERVQFLVRENLEDGDENIVEYGDEDDQRSSVQISTLSTMESARTTRLMAISPSITTNTTLSVMLIQTAVRTGIAPFTTGCEGSEVSQNITYRAI